MNCELIRKRIPEYIAGILNDEEKKRIEEHIQNCNKCREIYEQELKNMIKNNKINNKLIIKCFCKVAIAFVILCFFVIREYLKTNEYMNEARIPKENSICNKVNFNCETKGKCFLIEESCLSKKIDVNWLNNENNTYEVAVFKQHPNRILLILKNILNEKIYRVKYWKEINDKSIIYVKWYDNDNLFIQVGKKYDAEKEFLLNVINKKEVLLYDYIRE